MKAPLKIKYNFNQKLRRTLKTSFHSFFKFSSFFSIKLYQIFSKDFSAIFFKFISLFIFHCFQDFFSIKLYQIFSKDFSAIFFKLKVNSRSRSLPFSLHNCVLSSSYSLKSSVMSNTTRILNIR